MAVTIAERIHLFPYRTQKLSSLAPKVLGLTAREDRLLPPSIHGNGLRKEVRFFFCIIKFILQQILQPISVSVIFIKFPHFMFCSCFCVLLHAAGSAFCVFPWLLEAVLYVLPKSKKTKFVVCIVACILAIAAYLTIALVISYCPMPVWARVVVLVCGFLSVAAVIAPILLVAVNIEVFTCPKCGKRFVPTLTAYILGPHTLRKRRLKCPHCGQKSWCVSNLRAGDMSSEYRTKD